MQSYIGITKDYLQKSREWCKQVYKKLVINSISNTNKNKNKYLTRRRGESNFISAIKSTIDTDMARQQRVNGIF